MRLAPKIIHVVYPPNGPETSMRQQRLQQHEDEPESDGRLAASDHPNLAGIQTASDGQTLSEAMRVDMSEPKDDYGHGRNHGELP